MTREELIHKLRLTLSLEDSDSKLINFWDDTVDWEAIAKIAVDFCLEPDNQLFNDRTLEKVYTAIESHGNSKGERDCIINDILNVGIIFRERK